MSNISNYPQNKGQGIGASCSFLLLYLYPYTLNYYRYTKKYKCDALGGIIVTRIDLIRVTRREQLCIFMKHKDFVYHELR